MFIDIHKDEWRIESICRVLTDFGIKIAPRTYRYHKHHQPSARDISDAYLINEMWRLRTGPTARGKLPRERFYGRHGPAC